jgi:hypothetical protein
MEDGAIATLINHQSPLHWALEAFGDCGQSQMQNDESVAAIRLTLPFKVESCTLFPAASGNKARTPKVGSYKLDAN